MEAIAVKKRLIDDCESNLNSHKTRLTWAIRVFRESNDLYDPRITDDTTYTLFPLSRTQSIDTSIILKCLHLEY